jgi:hypothetical protein
VAGASADGEINHWPAFVDVLTTVIMVVTFLLVIMSAAVMTLSQRAMEHFKQQLLAKEEARHHKDFDKGAASAAAAAAAQASPSAAPQAPAGTSVAELGSVLRSETPVNGAERLTIRTRETRDTLQVQVKAIEEASDTRGVEVQTADVLIKVAFEPTAVRFDAENAVRVVAFLKAKMTPGMTYEIWSLAPQGASISEAQRLAYYRAAMTRNMLIKAGIRPADIHTQIRVTDSADKDGHNVRVVLKP